MVVPPSDDDLRAVDGDHDRFVATRRCDLLVEAVEQLHEDGVEPDVWKVEGLPTPGECERVAAACRSGGRDDVGLVVLGAGARPAVVEGWLTAAAGVDGYRGFAVGRTIWADELRRHLRGETTEEEVVDGVAANYLRFVDTYRRAAARGRPA